MTISVARSVQLTIGGRTFKTSLNPAFKKSWRDHLIDYTKKSSGAFNVLYLMDKICQLSALVLEDFGSVWANTCRDFSGKLMVAWTWLVIPGLPGFTKNLVSAVKGFGEPSQWGLSGARQRKTLKDVHDIFQCCSMWSYAAILMKESTALKNFADITNLVANSTELTQNIQDWQMAKGHIEVLGKNQPKYLSLHQRFLEKMRVSFLLIVQSVVRVVDGILGLYLILNRNFVVKPYFPIVLSLIATITGISAYFYQETSQFKQIDFFKIKSPELNMN